MKKKCTGTPSMDLLKRLIGTSPTPRMLTKYEIELLKQSELEVIATARSLYENYSEDRNGGTNASF